MLNETRAPISLRLLHPAAARAADQQRSSAGGTGDHRLSPDAGSQAAGAAGRQRREQGRGAAVAGAQSHQAGRLQEGGGQEPFEGSAGDLLSAIKSFLFYRVMLLCSRTGTISRPWCKL